MIIDAIAQPSGRTTLQAIDRLLQHGPFDTLCVAAAYVTTGGLSDLIQTFENRMGQNWTTMNKRWITSFDYCRTDPIAINGMMTLPASELRVYDAQFCLKNRGIPKIPFHPKAFLLSKKGLDCVLAGSGNLSRSGLTKGIEAGIALGSEAGAAAQADAIQTIKRLKAWYKVSWDAAGPINQSQLSQYSSLYEDAENVLHPTPTDDDVASTDRATGALSDKDLQKLRVSQHFWIDAGNVTKNRGPNLPGNQLMMKRMSRVFFGFEPTNLEENSALGTIRITFANNQPKDYSFTYSDNKMDKLVLPIPGSDGPSAYDNEIVVFTKKAIRLFEMRIAKSNEKNALLKKSTAVGGAFKMSSGREWGVY